MPEPERSIEGNNRANDSPSSRGREGGEGSPPGGGILGVLLTPVTMIAAGIAAAVSELWNDPAIRAAGRQGLDELGTALKPFPDSIQVDEVGSIWNPPYADRGDSRDEGLVRRSSLLPPPGWAEEHASRQRENDLARDNGKDQGMSI